MSIAPHDLEWQITTRHGIVVEAPNRNTPHADVTWPVARVHLWPWARATTLYHARLIVAAPRLLALVRRAVTEGINVAWLNGAREITAYIDGSSARPRGESGTREESAAS